MAVPSTQKPSLTHIPPLEPAPGKVKAASDGANLTSEHSEVLQELGQSTWGRELRSLYEEAGRVELALARAGGGFGVVGGGGGEEEKVRKENVVEKWLRETRPKDEGEDGTR